MIFADGGTQFKEGNGPIDDSYKNVGGREITLSRQTVSLKKYL